MYPIKEVRQILAYSPMTQKNEMMTKNVCINVKNKKEMVRHWDGYYYLSKDGKTITRTRVKL